MLCSKCNKVSDKPGGSVYVNKGVSVYTCYDCVEAPKIIESERIAKQITESEKIYKKINDYYSSIQEKYNPIDTEPIEILFVYQYQDPYSENTQRCIVKTPYGNVFRYMDRDEVAKYSTANTEHALM